MAEEEVNQVAALLSEFNTKISDLESRHEMLRERVFSLGNTFIKSRDDLKRELNSVRDDMRNIKDIIEKIQENLRHVLIEMDNFARKDELRILEKYMKLWEPLKFTRTEDVKSMIDDAVRNLKEGEGDKTKI
jgi:chromosome segregation ATPase